MQLDHYDLEINAESDNYCAINKIMEPKYKDPPDFNHDNRTILPKNL